MHPSVTVHVFLLLFHGGWVLMKEECIKTAVTSCDNCIKSGPGCAWCTDLNFTKPGELEAVRCDTREELIKKLCPEGNIMSPSSATRVITDKPLSAGGNIVQVQPQEIDLDLRPGEAHTFQMKFKRAEGYPVDLYYLMDLSYSMEDDLKNVKNLGIEILNKLNRITGSARIGFGSFVDKTLLPFTDTSVEKLKKPCPPKEQECQPPFGYRHVLSMTNNVENYKTMVSQQKISGNLDTPEGGLDAIMQAATCVDQIGWGNSTRLLVLATDAGFHMAGDGKLAGILEPNQEVCQMDSSNLYAKSSTWDYPSVGQVARKLEEQNIQPIFAVTEDVADVYRELSKLIPKSDVGVLSKDSSNVVNLIVNAYNKLSSNIIINHDVLPDDVSVTFTSNCNDGEKPSDKGTCNNVNIGQEVIFSVTVKASTCLNAKKSFNVGPLGFNEKLKVNINPLCTCQCGTAMNKMHHHCNLKGEVVCGVCSCAPGYLGQRCECSLGQKDEVSLKAQCRKDNGTECEGQGDCECGVCKCHLTEGGNSYYGTHCECDNEHCEKYQNLLCGGNGQCHCGTCNCKPGFEGTACQCKTVTDSCETDTTMCHGRGKCRCNQCECERGYKPPKCEFCPTCIPPCQQHASCIECRGFGSGPFEKNCSESCSHLITQTVEKLIKSDCQVKNHMGCRMFFTMTEQDGFDKYYVKILKDVECPEGPNVGAIVGGSLAGVALIGLLILMIIKAIFYVKDLKEWRKFEKEMQRSKWANSDNPLFKKATTTVANPAFTGDS